MRGRLVYGVHHAITTSSDGYAVRGHALARALRVAGIALKVLVAPSELTARLPFRVTVDEIDYLHLASHACADYRCMLQVFKPDAVLAASNWSHAQPLQHAARQLGIPFWYEARGFWEFSRCAREPSFASTDEFRHAVASETAIALGSDRLFTLNRHMAAEWVRRGVAPKKISLIPNGATAISLAKPTPSPAMQERLKPGERQIIAYLGSFSAYEGLDDLITAFARIYQRGVNAHLLLVGSLSLDGSSTHPCQRAGHLQALARELGVADRLLITGRMDPSEMSSLSP